MMVASGGCIAVRGHLKCMENSIQRANRQPNRSGAVWRFLWVAAILTGKVSIKQRHLHYAECEGELRETSCREGTAASMRRCPLYCRRHMSQTSASHSGDLVCG